MEEPAFSLSLVKSCPTGPWTVTLSVRKQTMGRFELVYVL